MERKSDHATAPATPSSKADGAASNAVAEEAAMEPLAEHRVSLDELRERTHEIVEAAQEREVIITDHGTARVVIRAYDEEEMEIGRSLRSPEVREQFRRSFEDLRAGRTVPLSSYLREVDEKSPERFVRPSASIE
jgi:prevent-host-death family protein